MSKNLKTYTVEEVAKHNTADDCWIIVDGKVYDLTKFMKLHPGGKAVLVSAAGTDSTEDFFAMHKASILDKYPKLVIGTVGESKQPPKKHGSLSRVPFAESVGSVGLPSPFYNESHHKFRKELRAFIDKEIIPEAEAEEEGGSPPEHEVWKKCGEAGLLASRIGKACMKPEFLKDIKLPGGVKPEEFDHFHEQIAHEEMGRIGCPSYVDGLGAGFVIGLPPIIHFGPKAVQDEVVTPVLKGEKRICLAISEPWAGSDVANIRCEGKLSPCGKFWIVNGVKKWITNGVFADYFVTAVRTGGKGIGGISLFNIPRCEGLTTKAMKTTYGSCAGTAYVMYDNVKVPVENLLGKLNKGFQCIMWNFNHERWFIIASLVRAMRLAYEDAMLWANQRKVFGKNLLSQPVIRGKLANIASNVESIQNWLENITYQMDKLPYDKQALFLAGPIALLKYKATRAAWDIADDTTQVFGGRGITRTGMGARSERFLRGVKYAAILGGSEEIMADLAIRQAGRFMDQKSKL